VTTKTRRPVTVWIAQAVLLISALLWLFVLAMNLDSIAQNPDETAVAGDNDNGWSFWGYFVSALSGFLGADETKGIRQVVNYSTSLNMVAWYALPEHLATKWTGETV